MINHQDTKNTKVETPLPDPSILFLGDNFHRMFVLDERGKCKLRYSPAHLRHFLQNTID